jgi:hypothetical protein
VQDDAGVVEAHVGLGVVADGPDVAGAAAPDVEQPDVAAAAGAGLAVEGGVGQQVDLGPGLAVGVVDQGPPADPAGAPAWPLLTQARSL